MGEVTKRGEGEERDRDRERHRGDVDPWPSAAWRPRTSDIPDAPGVYRFMGESGKVVYVGKAKRLRDRLSTYFGDPSRLHPRTQAMLAAAREVRWTIVASEVEALVLEQSWIHEYDPRFNVRMRDGKSYPSLALTVGEKYPRALVWRGERKPGIRYFGPYPQGRDVRDTLDALLRVFPVRSCSAGFFERHRREGRPCLLADMHRCAAPCVGRITEGDHRKLAESMGSFLNGNAKPTLDRLQVEMEEAAANLEFEKAARRRDDLTALKSILQKQNVVLDADVSADVLVYARDELTVAWYAFHVRGGVVRGVRTWVVDAPAGDEAEAVGAFLDAMYAEVARESGLLLGAAESSAPTETLDLPAEVLVPTLPPDASALEGALTNMRGRRVHVRVPKRGPKADLLATVTRNATDVLTATKLRRAGDLSARSAAMSALGEAIGAERMPLRIECYDISHTQGTNAMGSMVVFEDGLARKDQYRTFKISPESSGDDVASIAEVLRRRFARAQAEEAGVDPTTGEVVQTAEAGSRSRFASTPDLVVVDGGQPQVNAAAAAMAEAGVELPLIGLAKRLEEVWLPDDDDPVILPRTSEALYLLQRLRDEAHRFAITAHRKRRGKEMRGSALDAVNGLGPARRKALLKHFGSVKRIRSASVEELSSVPGIGPGLAQSVLDQLGGGDPPAAEGAAPNTEGAGGEVGRDLPAQENRPEEP